MPAAFGALYPEGVAYAKPWWEALVANPAQAIWGALTLPGDVYAGKTRIPAPGIRREDFTDIPAPRSIAGQANTAPFSWHPIDDVVQRSTDLAGVLAGGAPVTAQSGAAGIFGGRLAKTADKQALERAESLAASGASRDQIWNETGWFKGRDDQWRFEIPDDKARMAVPVKDWISRENGTAMAPHLGAAYRKAASDLVPEAPVRVKRLIEHDELSQAYPGAMETPVLLRRQGSTDRGSFDGDTIAANEALDPMGAKSTLLHELQHGVQRAEGFATGGNTYGLRPGTPAWDIYQERLKAISTPLSHEKFSSRARYEGLAPLKDYNEYLKTTRNIPPFIDRAAQDYAVQEAYKRSAGEVEARNVQARAPMTPEERRASPPWQTQDTPDEQQFVNFRSGVMESRDEPQGITAYHGSPHDFDRFSMEKIGTGEGAQAYGHGLYFAENPVVADTYKANISVPMRINDGPPDWKNPEHIAAAWVYNNNGDRLEALRVLESVNKLPGEASDEVTKAIELLRNGAELPKADKPGRMYEVRIKADPERFLDWDKPLYEQSPEIQKVGEQFRKGEIEEMLSPIRGERLYRSLAPKGEAGTDYTAATNALREAGIPGIRYLDQGSRTAGEGSRNYVVFDDSIVEILRKYGLAGLAPLGAAGMTFGSLSPQGNQ